MKIFCAISLNNMEESLFLNTLRSMGHEVIHHGWKYEDTYTVDWNTGLKHDTNLAMLKKIEDAHSEKPIDLFFSYMSNRTTYPFIIEEITKNKKIPSVNFCWDDRRKVRLQDEIAKHFSLCWTTDKVVDYEGKDISSVEAYKRIGATAIQLPAGANPDLFKPCILEEFAESLSVKSTRTAFCRRYPISFIGSGGGGLSYRDNILSEVQKVFGDKLHLFGGIVGGRVTTDEYIDIIHNSQIVLGFSGSPGAHETCSKFMTVKGRDFEVPMAGGFYLTEHNPDLEELYFIAHLANGDKEMDTYRSTEDLIQKIGYYLDFPDECAAIGQRGMLRARKDHTMQKRFEVIFERLGLT